MALRRLVLWLLIAVMAAFGLYYLVGGPREVADTTQPEPAPRTVSAHAIPAPAPETVPADTPSEITARDLAAAIDQMTADQQREIEAMKPEPKTDGSMMTAAPMKAEKP